MATATLAQLTLCNPPFCVTAHYFVATRRKFVQKLILWSLTYIRFRQHFPDYFEIAGNVVRG